MKNRKQTLKVNSRVLSRRHFMGNTAAAVAAFTIVPRHVLGGAGRIPPSEKVNVAAIGAGGIAKVNIHGCSLYANIVALCDVDGRQAAEMFNKYPDVPKYRDFRVMLEKENKTIDAVIIATPDHTHAVATMAAMKMGKHIYTQKPLTHSIDEARMLTEAARRYKVATQMGNQGQSTDATRTTQEFVADGAIGPIREVHCWTNRPGAFWEQGITRPAETPPVPPELDWDLWLGPAPFRPYHPQYVPSKWRGFWDFGTGPLGDMGCHLLDVPFLALKLGSPVSVQASYSVARAGEDRQAVEKETFPLGSMIKYEFPARGAIPPVDLYWYDGGLTPFAPKDFEEGRKLPSDGYYMVGDKGVMMAPSHGGLARLIPESKMKEYKRPPHTLPCIDAPQGAAHEWDWLQACKGIRPACSNFDNSGPLTETVLVGNLALRCGGKKLLWDGLNMKVTNCPEANAFVRQDYRPGWLL
jgi:predicted dehydrogenase